jgi:hypothetical protein
LSEECLERQRAEDYADVEKPMKSRSHKGLHSLTAFFDALACVLSIVMLLSFPAGRLHSFGDHFRTPEVRRTTQRHTYVAAEGQRVQENAVRSDVLPTFFAPVETPVSLVSDRLFESPSEIPLVRLLNRLKLNPSGSSGQDPLLQA